MDADRAGTPGVAAEPGEATPAPPMFVAAVWVGVFAVILWGMFLLWGRRLDGSDD